MQIRYASYHTEPIERRVDPYGLLFRRQHWYLSGYCHLRQDLRIFRLDRIQQLTLLGQNFTRPENFNAAEHFNASLNQMPGNLSVKVMLHTDLTTAAEQLGLTASLLKPQVGGLLLSFQIDNCDCLALWLSQLPFDFTILQPTELKQALKNQAQRLLRLAGDGH